MTADGGDLYEAVVRDGIVTGPARKPDNAPPAPAPFTDIDPLVRLRGARVRRLMPARRLAGRAARCAQAGGLRRRRRRRAFRAGARVGRLPRRGRSATARRLRLRGARELDAQGRAAAGHAARATRSPLRNAHRAGYGGFRLAVRGAGAVGSRAHRSRYTVDDAGRTLDDGAARGDVPGVGARLPRFRAGRGMAARGRTRRGLVDAAHAESGARRPATASHRG